jgi:hypothetical protein
MWRASTVCRPLAGVRPRTRTPAQYIALCTGAARAAAEFYFGSAALWHFWSSSVRPEQISLANSMRAAGEPWENVATFCGVSVYGVRKAIDPDFRRRRRERAALHDERMRDLKAAVTKYREKRERQFETLCRFRRRPTVRNLAAVLHAYCEQCEVEVTGPPWRARFTTAVRFTPALLAADLGGDAFEQDGIIHIEGDTSIQCVADEYDLYGMTPV